MTHTLSTFISIRSLFYIIFRHLDLLQARIEGVDCNIMLSDKHGGGIRVRNMGRIMKMAMFIQKKPAKNFIREFKRYGCHCWPKGRITLGGQGKPVDDIDR